MTQLQSEGDAEQLVCVIYVNPGVELGFDRG